MPKSIPFTLTWYGEPVGGEQELPSDGDHPALGDEVSEEPPVKRARAAPICEVSSLDTGSATAAQSSIDEEKVPKESKTQLYDNTAEESVKAST